jgi:hypothetical protein
MSPFGSFLWRRLLCAKRFRRQPLTRNIRWTRMLRASPHFVERGDNFAQQLRYSRATNSRLNGTPSMGAASMSRAQRWPA